MALRKVLDVMAMEQDPSVNAAAQMLDASRCALLVVDVQEKLVPAIFRKDELIRNVQLLTRLAGILEIPAIVSTQYAKGLGGTIPQIAELTGDAATCDKTAFGCFASDAFLSLVKHLPGQRNTLLICGMETHICVMQTALGALQEGYIVHVASDAVGSRTEANWQVGLGRMRDAGVVISSTEMMIYELMRGSGGAAFKAMLPHLKG